MHQRRFFLWSPGDKKNKQNKQNVDMVYCFFFFFASALLLFVDIQLPISFLLTWPIYTPYPRLSGQFPHALLQPLLLFVVECGIWAGNRRQAASSACGDNDRHAALRLPWGSVQRAQGHVCDRPSGVRDGKWNRGRRWHSPKVCMLAFFFGAPQCSGLVCLLHE